MENLLKSYLEDVKNDVTKIRELKRLFVKHQQFELSSKIRDMELSLYPILEEDGILIDEAESFKTALAMAGINVSDESAFLVLNVSKLFIEKKLSTDLKSISKLKVLTEKLYK